MYSLYERSTFSEKLIFSEGELILPSQEDPLADKNQISPFLRWAGGKRSLIPQIEPRLPANLDVYYEPFLGGGALFFKVRPLRAILSDINPDLISCYLQVRSQPERVIDRLRQFRYSKDEYYRIRESKPKTEIGKAARFIYLNRTCWNGLYRVNRNGKFNVPFGRYKNPTLCNDKLLRSASNALGTAKIFVTDFEDAVCDAAKGDFVYMDPPYTVLHNNNSFLKYNDCIFKWSDQIRLAKLAKELDRRGCYVMISNAYSSSIRDLYIGFNNHILTRHSLISGRTEARVKVHEYLFTNY